MAELAMERSSNLRLGKTVLFPGTPAETEVETAKHEVRAVGTAKYIASEVNGIGCDDALALHAKAHGLTPYIPIWKRVADKIGKGLKVARATDKEVIPGPSSTPAAPKEIVPGSPEELAAALAAIPARFPDLQRAVFERWMADRAASGAAPPVVLPEEPAAAPAGAGA